MSSACSHLVLGSNGNLPHRYGAETYDSTLELKRWLEAEVASRLLRIDHKLDDLSGSLQNGFAQSKCSKGFSASVVTPPRSRSTSKTMVAGKDADSKEDYQAIRHLNEFRPEPIVTKWQNVSCTSPGPVKSNGNGHHLRLAPLKSEDAQVKPEELLDVWFTEKDKAPMRFVSESNLSRNRDRGCEGTDTDSNCKSPTRIRDLEDTQSTTSRTSRSKRERLSRDSFNPPAEPTSFIYVSLRQIEAFLDDPESGKGAAWYHCLMPTFTIATVFITLVQTVKPSPIEEATAALLEVTCDGIFIAELLLRFIVAKKMKNFFINPQNLVDFIASVPSIILRLSIGFTFSTSQEDLPAGFFLLYVNPMIRMLKTLRGFQKFNLLLTSAIRVYLETVPTMLMMLFVTLFYATLIYSVEPRDNISSYPQAIWLTLVSMATVGYGDVVPQSGPGYFIVSLLVCSSVFLMAIPLGIIGQAVSEVWRDRDTLLVQRWAKERLRQWGLTPEDIPALFRTFDPNGDGELDYPEFREMIQQMNIKMKEERMVTLFESFDSDRSGSIDSKEFVRKLYPDAFHKIFDEEREEIAEEEQNHTEERNPEDNKQAQQSPDQCDRVEPISPISSKGKNGVEKALTPTVTAESPREAMKWETFDGVHLTFENDRKQSPPELMNSVQTVTLANSKLSL